MRLVEVEWLDSMSEGGWMRADEARRRATVDAMAHRTVGYVIDENDHSLLLAMGRSNEGDEDSRLVHDTMQIPRVAILTVRDLKVSAQTKGA